MEREVFNTLKVGAKISEPRGREAPPIKGILADKVGETALMRTGYTPGGKPILRWAHYNTEYPNKKGALFCGQ